MITVQKLKTLPRKTRLRKIITLVQDMEYKAAFGKEGTPVDGVYLLRLIELLEEETKLPPWLLGKLSAGKIFLSENGVDFRETERVRRLCNDIRTGLQQYFNIEPADWDFIEPADGHLAPRDRKVLPFRVFLEDLRSPFNVGSIFRTAESFGAELIVLTPSVPTPEHKRVRRTAMGCTDIVPWEQREINFQHDGENLFVLETGGTDIGEFPFPKAGSVLIGSEELGISPDAATAADGSLGRVSIKTGGVKGSLNVSVAFGILMHRWFEAVSR